MGNTLEYLLKLSNGGFVNPLRQARDEQGRFHTEGQRGAKDVNNAINNMGGAWTSLAAKIGAAAAAIGVTAGVFAGLKKSMALAADAETTATAFKTLVGSASLASEVLSKIKKLGAETPFEFPELANAGRMLVAFGESARDVPETLRRLGDVASGVAAPIGDIAEIYGKARTAGSLFAEDINQLTGRGIPVIRAFAEILKRPEGEIKKLAEEGKITFPLLDQAFRNMTARGGQFHRMMMEQSATTNGLWSTLKDTVNELFLEFGKPLNDAIKPILTDAIRLAGQLGPLLQRMGAHTADALTAVRAFVMEAEKGGGVVVELGKKLKEAFAAVGEVLMVPIHAAMASLPALGKSLFNVVAPAVDWLDAKLEEGAYKFGRVLMRQMAEVASGLPPWLVGDAALNLNTAANASGKQGNLAAGRAGEISKAMPGFLSAAGDHLAGAVEDFNKELKARLDKIMYSLPEGYAMGQVPEFYNRGMTGGTDDIQQTKGLLDALNGANSSGSAGGGRGKTATDMAQARNQLMGEIAIARLLARGQKEKAAQIEKELRISREVLQIRRETGASEAEAVRLAKEKIELEERGKNRAAGVRNKIMGYKQGSGGRMTGEDGGSLADRRPGGMKSRMMGGNDAFFNGTQKPSDWQKLQSSESAWSRLQKKQPIIPKVNVPSPGTTKNTQARQAAAAASAQKAGERSRWDLVATIAGKLDKLTVAT